MNPHKFSYLVHSFMNPYKSSTLTPSFMNSTNFLAYILVLWILQIFYTDN
jgi:hypothetical protein